MKLLKEVKFLVLIRSWVRVMVWMADVDWRKSVDSEEVKKQSPGDSFVVLEFLKLSSMVQRKYV